MSHNVDDRAETAQAVIFCENFLLTISIPMTTRLVGYGLRNIEQKLFTAHSFLEKLKYTKTSMQNTTHITSQRTCSETAKVPLMSDTSSIARVRP